MYNLKIVTKNLVDTAIINPQSLIIQPPNSIDYLKTESRSEFVTFTDTTTYFSVDLLPGNQTVNSIVLGRHTVRQIADDNASVEFYMWNSNLDLIHNSGSLKLIPDGQKNHGTLLDPLSYLGNTTSLDGLENEARIYQNYEYFLDTSITGVSYVGIYIDNTTSPIFSLGRLFIGEYVSPKFGVTVNTGLTSKDVSKQYRTQAGTLRTDVETSIKQLDFTLDVVDQEENAELINALKYAGKQKDIYISLLSNEADPLLVKDYSGIVKLVKAPNYSEYAPSIYKSKYTVEEV